MEELKKVVLNDAKEHGDEFKSYLSDVADHGCEGGSCSNLIYTADCREFFDKHYEVIEELRQEWEENTGTSLIIKGDLKNFFAWFAYEYVARELLDELENNE